jgi:hypothetical protein
LPVVLDRLHTAWKPSGALLASNPRGQDKEGFVDGRYDGADIRMQAMRLAEKDAPFWWYDLMFYEEMLQRRDVGSFGMAALLGPFELLRIAQPPAPLGRRSPGPTENPCSSPTS